MNKKSRNKIVIAILLIAAAAAISLYALTRIRNAGGNDSALSVQYTTLAKTDIVDNINVSGTVKSAQSKNVYTNLSYKVKEIYVEEGDTVTAGDVLAILDTSYLEQDIEQSSYSTNASEKSAAIDLENKKLAYENALYLYNNGLNADIVNAQTALDSATLTLNDAQSSFEYNQFLYDLGEISTHELETSQTSLENAKLNYNKVSAVLASTKILAEQNLNTAKNSYEAAQVAAANKSQRTGLEKLEQQLEEAKITAPLGGTVTMVNATVGVVGSGILFVIEDTDDLIVSVSVEEYDISKVKVGQNATIKTDGTGTAVMTGVVSRIAPTTGKNASGETISSSNASFEVTVNVTQGNPALRIGMSARLSITLAEKGDTYVVPYEAVMQNSEGESFIYTLEKQASDYVIKELPVETGLENDLNIEILGDDISDGLLVVSNPSSFTPGSAVTIGK